MATLSTSASAGSPAPSAPRSWADWVTLAARLILGGVLLIAGLLKIGDLNSSSVSVRNFRLFPFDVATAIGYALPFVEIVLGALLILGLFTRVAAALGALMMLAYIAGIVSLWARGIAIDCGCFGGSDVKSKIDTTAYTLDILRDIGLLLCGAWVAWHPRSPFSLEHRLFGDPITIDEE